MDNWNQQSTNSDDDCCEDMIYNEMNYERFDIDDEFNEGSDDEMNEESKFNRNSRENKPKQTTLTDFFIETPE